jgi:hypothetical protein
MSLGLGCRYPVNSATTTTRHFRGRSTLYQCKSVAAALRRPKRRHTTVLNSSVRTTVFCSYLSRNILSGIVPGSFDVIAQTLQILHFESNQITSVQDNTFDQLTALTTL